MASRAAALSVTGLFAFSSLAHAATQTKNNTAGALNDGTKYVSGSAPGSGDIALFNSTITAAQTDSLGANYSLGELDIVNPGGLITITDATYTLTLNGVGGIGIDMSAATQNLTLNTGVTLGAAQTWTVASGRTLALGGTSLNAGANLLTVTGAGITTIAASTVISSTGGITKTGSGSLTITGAATNTNSIGTSTLSVNGGIVTLTDPSGGGANVLNSTANVAVGGGALLYSYAVSGANQSFTNLTVNPGESAIFANRNGSVNAGINFSGTVSRGIGGTITARPYDSSRDFVAFNSVAATTLLTSNGTAYLTIGDPASGTTLDNFQDWGAVNAAHQLIAVSYTTTTATALGTSAQNANVAVPTTTLAANTTVASFHDSVNQATTIDLNGKTLQTGGILVTSTVATAGSVIKDSVGGGSLTGPAGSDLTLMISANAVTPVPFTISANIVDNLSSGTGTALTKGAPGTLILSGSNTFTNGLYINDGTVQLGSNGALNATTPNAINFDASGFISGVANVVGGANGGTVASTPTLALAGYSPTVASISTANDQAGTTPVIENANGASVSNATLTVNGSTTNTFAGILQNGTGGGTLGLTKAGTGSLTLTGANTYTGPTNVNGGTLTVGTGGTISTSPTINVGSAGTLNVTANGLTIPSGNTLSGAGTVSGAVAVSSGGILSPGNGAVATLTIGSLTLNNGSITNFAFGTGNSQISTGALTLNGTDGINLYQAGTTNPFSTPGTYTLFTDTSLAGTGTLSVSDTVGGESYTFNTTGTTVKLTIASTGGTVSTWNLDANGNYSVPANWTNGVPNSVAAVATFGSVITAPRTVSVDGTFTVGEIDFNNANAYTLAPAAAGNGFIFDNNGSAAVISDLNGTHAVQTPIALALGLTVNVANAADLLTLSGAISNTGAAGTGMLNKTGAGTLALLGTNTFDGGVDITNGTVQINSAASLGATGGLATLDSSSYTVTLEAQNSIVTTRSFALTGMNNIIKVDGTSTYEIDGTVGQSAGSGTLTLTGTGTLALGANNSFLPIVTVSAGTLSLGAGGTAGSVSGSITDNAAVALNRTDTYTLGNLISGTGTLTQTGSGNTTLSAANTFTGNTVVAGGTLTLGTALALQNSTLVYDNQGGTLSFGTLTAATLGGLSGGQNLALTNAATTPAAVALTVGGNNSTTTYSGSLSGGGSLVKTGSGTLTLPGTESYTGNTTVNGGALTLTGSLGSATTRTGAISLTGTLNVNGGSVYAASLGIPNSPGFVSLSGGGTLNLTGTLAVTTNGSASSGLASLGSGTVTVNAITVGRQAGNTGTAVLLAGSTAEGVYVNGATVADATTLDIGNATIATSGANFREDSGAVTVGGLTTVTNNAGGRISVMDINGGTFTSTNTAGVQVGGGVANVSQIAELLVRGTGVLTAPTITLGTAVQTGGADYFEAIGGTTYVGGGGIVAGGATGTTLTIALGNATVATAPVIGATADWSSSLPMTLTNSNTAATPTFQAADAGGTAHNITLSGALSGAGGLTKTGAGTLFLSAPNSYTGITTLTAGTLNINGEYALGGAVYGGLTFNGGTLQYATAFTGNGTGDISQDSNGNAKTVTFTSTATIDVNGNAITYAKPVGNGGTGGLTLKSTAAGGSLTLNGANTYTGATAVNSGTLFVNGSVGSNTTPAGAVTVASGATLGGSGTLTVASGSVAGTLAPGATAGATTGALTLTTTGGLTLSGTLVISLNSTSGVSSGTVLNTSALTLTGATLSLTGSAANGTTTYDLVNYTGTLNGTFASANIPSGYTINYNGSSFTSSDIELDPMSSVPEPATWLAGFLMVGALGYKGRKQIGSLFAA